MKSWHKFCDLKPCFIFKTGNVSHGVMITYFISAIKHHEHIIEEVYGWRGTAGASSEYDTDRYEAERAFETNYAYGWKSKNNYGNAPEMVWYKFRASFVPDEVSFRSNGETQKFKNNYILVFLQ